RETTTQPAARDAQPATRRPTVTKGLSLPDTIRAHQQPARQAPPANARPANQPTTRPSVGFNELLDATTQPDTFENWSEDARNALRLTGADVTVTEAGPGMLYVDGVESDV